MLKHKGNYPRKKGKLLVISLAVLCLCILSGTTLAYLVTGTDPISQIFVPGKVSCEVVKENETVAENYAEKVKIKNTGNVPAYIRATIVVTYEAKDADGNITVSAIVPDEGDYRIQFSDSTNWKKAADGFWYYTQPVAAGDTTEDLIAYCCKTRSVAPAGYSLSVEVVASAIQASSTNAVVDSWNSGVERLNGGNLVIEEATNK